MDGSPKVHQRVLNRKLQEVESEARVCPLSVVLRKLGIEWNSLPSFKNGDLMRIAEVDSATLHCWQHLDSALPEEAMDRLKKHFRCMIKKR